MTSQTFANGYALLIGVGADLPVTAQDLSPTVSGDADVVARDKIDLRESQGAIVNPVTGAVITQQFGHTTNINTGGGDYAGRDLSK